MTQQNQETVTKQKNPLRAEQGRKLVEYNKRKKEELKCLNDQITKQDYMTDHKPKPNTNTYVYAVGLSVLGLAIGGYLLYSKFKKPERKLIDVPAPPVAKTNTEPNTYVYAVGLSVLGLAIGGYLLYSKFKKPERKLIDVPAPPVAKTNTEPKRDIFEML